MIAKPSGYDDAWLQILMIVVILSEKNQGIPSSGIKFCFWGALVIYASIKLCSYPNLVQLRPGVYIQTLRAEFISELKGKFFFPKKSQVTLKLWTIQTPSISHQLRLCCTQYYFQILNSLPNLKSWNKHWLRALGCLCVTCTSVINRTFMHSE